MKKRFTLILPLIIVAAMLSGCMGSSYGYYETPMPSGAPAPTPSQEIQPQQLIDRKTAETLVGNKLKDVDATKPNEDKVNGMIFCQYNADTKQGKFLQVAVYRRTELYNHDPEWKYQAFQPTTPTTTASNNPKPTALITITPVEGVGDKAFIADPGIHIMSNGYYIIISVGDPELPENQQILKAAGSKAVENLKALLGVK